MQIEINLQIFIFILIFILTRQIKIYAYLMLFAFVHELGHLFTGLFLGLKPKTLKIMPFGVSILFNSYEGKKISSQKKFFIAVAGPLVNIAIAMISAILKAPLEIIYSNILIAIFNLLPVYPLDGGRMIEAILMRINPEIIADKYVIKISNIMLVILTAASSILILYFKNIAIFFVLIYLWVVVAKENKKYQLKRRVYDILQKEKENLDI